MFLCLALVPDATVQKIMDFVVFLGVLLSVHNGKKTTIYLVYTWCARVGRCVHVRSERGLLNMLTFVSRLEIICIAVLHVRVCLSSSR